MHVNAGAPAGQERASDAPGLALEWVANFLMWCWELITGPLLEQFWNILNHSSPCLSFLCLTVLLAFVPSLGIVL